MILQPKIPRGTGYSFVKRTSIGSDANVADVDLIPMINVVFLLLIFFMLVGVFRTAEDSTIVPPSAQHSMVMTPTVEIARLLIRADGSVMFAGEAVDVERLPLLLAELPIKENILIRADATVSANAVITILRILADSGRTSAKLQTIKSVASPRQ